MAIPLPEQGIWPSAWCSPRSAAFCPAPKLMTHRPYPRAFFWVTLAVKNIYASKHSPAYQSHEPECLQPTHETFPVSVWSVCSQRRGINARVLQPNHHTPMRQRAELTQFARQQTRGSLFNGRLPGEPAFVHQARVEDAGGSRQVFASVDYHQHAPGHHHTSERAMDMRPTRDGRRVASVAAAQASNVVPRNFRVLKGMPSRFTARYRT